MTGMRELNADHVGYRILYPMLGLDAGSARRHLVVHGVQTLRISS